MFKDKYSKFALIIISIFFIINLFNINDYGISWDEPTQRNIGKASLGFFIKSEAPISVPPDFKYYGAFFEILNYFVSNFAINILGFSIIASNHLLGIYLLLFHRCLF